MSIIHQARRTTREAVTAMQKIMDDLERTSREVGSDTEEGRQIDNGRVNLKHAIRYAASAYGLLAVRSAE